MKLVAVILIMLAWQHARESSAARTHHMPAAGPAHHTADSMYFRDTIGPLVFDLAKPLPCALMGMCYRNKAGS